MAYFLHLKEMENLQTALGWIHTWCTHGRFWAGDKKFLDDKYILSVMKMVIMHQVHHLSDACKHMAEIEKEDMKFLVLSHLVTGEFNIKWQHLYVIYMEPSGGPLRQGYHYLEKWDDL